MPCTVLLETIPDVINHTLHHSGCGQLSDDLMDVQRVEFLKKYIASTLKAIRYTHSSLDVLAHEIHQEMLDSRDGANVKGYSVWALMDQYEVFGGYKAYFGLIRVDFRDRRRQRQPRFSAYWYSDFLKNNASIQVESGAATTTSHAQM